MDTIEKLVNQAQEVWEDEAFQQRLEDAKSRLAEMVRKNPAGSIGVAVLAGFLLGKITKSGKK